MRKYREEKNANMLFSTGIFIDLPNLKVIFLTKTASINNTFEGQVLTGCALRTDDFCHCGEEETEVL